MKPYSDVSKPSGWWFVFAGLVGATVLGLFIYFLFTGIFGLTDGLTQVVVPGKAELKLVETGGYTIFHEYRSRVKGKTYTWGVSLTGLTCHLTAPSGDEVPLRPASVNSTYSINERAGTAVLEFTIAEPGVYQFSAAYSDGRAEPEGVLAIGHGFVSKLVTLILTCIATLVFGEGIAVAIVVVTIVRRRRAAAEGGIS